MRFFLSLTFLLSYLGLWLTLRDSLNEAILRSQTIATIYKSLRLFFILHFLSSILWVTPIPYALVAQVAISFGLLLLARFFCRRRRLFSDKVSWLLNQYSWLDALVRHSPAPVALLDINQKYLLVPDSHRELYMLPPDPLLKFYSASCPPPDFFQQLKENPFPQSYPATEIGDKILKWQASPLIQEEGYQGTVLYTEDVTALVEKNAKLERVCSELERFTYTVSHDLRSPLRSIRSFAELLIEEQGESDYLKRIITATDRMGGFLSALLDHSRAGGELKISEFSIGDLILEVNEILSADLQLSKTYLFWDPSKLPRIRADRTQVLALFQNLISNAIKYSGSEKSPRIEVGALDRENEVLLWIEDNGPGIPNDKLSQVFELFHRESSLSDGLGIGLATCRKIIEAHQGQIWFEKDRKSGAKVFLTLSKFHENA